MKKKTKLSLFSKNNNGVQAKTSWPWPSCHKPRTHSFRSTDQTPESCFSNSSESPSFSTASDESGHDPVESIIRGLRLKSERLFFEPGEAKILGPDEELPFKETTILSMESFNPFVDFKESMEEMVEAQGLKDWESLEELLGWYLKVNEKSSDGYILGAFIVLLLKLSISSSSTVCCDHHSPSSTACCDHHSPASSSSTACCDHHSPASTACCDHHSPASSSSTACCDHHSPASSSLSFYTSSYSLLSSSSFYQDTSISTPCESSLSQKKIIEDEDNVSS